jgi:hypothetical protein
MTVTQIDVKQQLCSDVIWINAHSGQQQYPF